MKKYLLAGIATLLPFILTILLIGYIFNLLTEPFAGGIQKLGLFIEKKYQLDLFAHDKIILIVSRIIALIALFFLVLVLGFFAQKFFFKALLRFFHRCVLRLPVVGGIYRFSKEVTRAFFSGEEKTFKYTVLVPFPSEQTYALGFVTGQVPPILKELIPQADLAVFVPTAPHPISGFILLTPEKFVREVDLSVEDSFKFLISCGVLHPSKVNVPVEPEKP